MVLKLYGGPRTRASIVQWYLEESQIPYELVSLDLSAGEHRQSDFLAINPFGKVPAIVDGDLRLWESGAILLYLADQHGHLPATPAERAPVTQWVLFANSTLSTGLFSADNRERELPKLLPPLQEHLAQQPFLLGTEFSVADVAVGSLLIFATMMLQLDFADYPAIADYVQRLQTRPSFAASLGQR